MDTILLVGLGGFLGANARYLFSLWISQQIAKNHALSSELGTLFVNFTGSLLLAVFLTWAANRVQLPTQIRLLIATGFFGGFGPLAGKIFRVGMLMFGKPPDFKTLIRWVRMA